MKLTTEISGCDAERLADCIKFAAKNNLSIDEHTQAGLNQNSGNVWLWSEDWAGCIYQDIGFNGPQFSWSCPNCGDEVDCSTLSELEALGEHFYNNENCSNCEE